MSDRVFLALPISERLQGEIQTWEQQFKNIPVRWLKGKNLHLTLIPPWEENNIGKLIEALKREELRIGSFEINLNRVSFGPNPREPRLIWAEGQTPPQLLQLKSSLEQTLGFRPDPRPFRLHLTLARFRPEQFKSFPTATMNETVEWHDTISHVVLFKSHLLPTGAEYKTLCQIPL